MMGRKAKALCACGKHPIEQQFGTCIDCFARAAVVCEALAQIARDYSPLQALAVRPILEKCVVTGWREEYVAEYQANLAVQITRAEKEVALSRETA